MLPAFQVFKSVKSVHDWSKLHNIPVGDIQEITNVWEFAKDWYGCHLNKDWRKWSLVEAQQMFKKYGLTGDIWCIEVTDGSF